MLKETKDTYEGMLESSITWFEYIVEWCNDFSSGKSSNYESITNIKGIAIRAAEYIKKRLKGGEE